MRSVSVKSRSEGERFVFVKRVGEGAIPVFESKIVRLANERAGGLDASPDVRSERAANVTNWLFASLRTRYEKSVAMFADHSISEPNQSSEPTRPAVRFLTMQMRAKVAGYLGLV